MLARHGEKFYFAGTLAKGMTDKHVLFIFIFFNLSFSLSDSMCFPIHVVVIKKKQCYVSFYQLWFSEPAAKSVMLPAGFCKHVHKHSKQFDNNPVKSTTS